MSSPDQPPFDHLVDGPASGNGGVAPRHATEESSDDWYVEPEPERGSRLDDWWAHVLRTPGRQKLWYWGGPILVTLIAGILRFWNLGHPHALVFDETFYVKDAYTLLNNGYESAWPEDANASFVAGDTDVFSDSPSYVVHPPLGKWLIALGLAAFGAGDAFAWRAMTALIGTIAVFLFMLIARRMLASTVLTVIGGLLFAIDGHAIVMSRVAILDNSVMFFALLGFGCILLDRSWHEKRLSARVDATRAAGDSPGWGAVIWWRPWLVAAGIAFGLTAGVKWSGFYFLAGFGVYLIVVDALARRRLGLPFWISASILKQGPATFLLLVPVSITVYLSTWLGWFVTSGGYYRQWAEQAGNAWTGTFAWVPPVWQSFFHYQQSIYSFHVGLHTPHPYQANPLSWLLMIRPTSMYYLGVPAGDDCAASACSQAITSIANPLIWWAAVAAMLYLVYRLARFREWQVGLILMGVLAGYGPWLLYSGRTVFQFYTITFEPYLLLALTVVIGLILGKRTDESYYRHRGIGVVAVFLFFAILLSVFWYPLWTGTTVPFWYWQLHSWLPSWV